MRNTTRTALLTLSSFLLGACALLLQGCSTTVAYVSNADSREISVLKLDRNQGSVQSVQTVAVGGAVMPLAISPDKRFLYASLRSEPYTVTSFAIDKSTGKLTAIGSAPLPDSMANIATDHSGRWLFAASYGGHKMSVSPIGADGVAGAASTVLPTGKNAHTAVPDLSNKYVFVTNLGSDQVLQFNFDAATGTLSPNTTSALLTRPGSGPRHLVFHPNGRYAYMTNELDGGVDLLAIDAGNGTLRSLKTWPTVPKGFSGKPWTADLHLTPDGRFLYTSERTSSTLGMWRVDSSNGELTLIGHVPTEKQPRGFQIDPSGQWLLAVGQLSNALTVYRIDPQTGQLQAQTSLSVGKNPNWVEIVQLP
jgi:6-phosphogluconolactonase